MILDPLPQLERHPVPFSERESWPVLSSADGVGPMLFMRLLRRYRSARDVLQVASGPNGSAALKAAGLLRYDQESDEMPELRSLDPSVADAIVAAARGGRALLSRTAELGLTFLTLDDDDYPPRLLAIDDPPPVLYVRGNPAALATERAIAIVGTRRATGAGLRLAGEIAAAVAHSGACIVSGLARGIDGVAHEAAVKAGRPTVAVFGTGLASTYPAVHTGLADRIVAAGGALVSELPPDTRGAHWSFPQRNRLISGLADAVIVVEAPRRSGALITADHALSQGRECFLVPGMVGQKSAEGALRYLRGYHGQARIVVDLPLLMEDLGFVVDVRPGANPRALAVGETEKRIAALVIGGTSTVDALVASTRLPVGAVLSALTLLEMRGLIAAAYGRYRPAGALLPEIRRKSVGQQGRSPPSAGAAVETHPG